MSAKDQPVLDHRTSLGTSAANSPPAGPDALCAGGCGRPPAARGTICACGWRSQWRRKQAVRKASAESKRCERQAQMMVGVQPPPAALVVAQAERLMGELAERYLGELVVGYQEAIISARSDLLAGEWQARDRGREWLIKAVRLRDESRGLLTTGPETVEAEGRHTLTEVWAVLRRVQGIERNEAL